MKDPPVHIGSDLNLDGAVRNMVASTFGVAANLPSLVTTGCGLEVPRGDTSRLPDAVTCVPCRAYAHERFLGYAEQIERLGPSLQMNLTHEQIRQAASASREIAAKFAGPRDG